MKKPIWKKILIFLLLYVVARGLGYVIGKYEAQKEINDPTGVELTEIYRKSHVEGCTKVGSSESLCSCTFDGLIERLGLAGYEEMGKIATEKDASTPEAERYISIGTEELLKCREKEKNR